MKTELIMVGKTVDKLYTKGISDYQERIGHYMPFNITVIPALKNTKSLSEDQQKQAEGELILRLIQPSDTVVLLDEHGAERTSMEMAAWLTRKQQTARLVFNSKVGDGVTATVVDMGNRFRLIVNDVHCIKPKPLPKLPVANALWIPQPNFEIGAGAWILAGGTHHSCFSYDITPEYWEDYAEMLNIEYLHIDKDSTFESVKRDLRINEVYYMLNKALM